MNPTLSPADAPSRAALPPLERRRVADDALVTLRKAIIAGAFAPGDHLAEGALAQQFGVSRAPVREAMMQLEREGLLEFDRRGAAHVRAFTVADFEEIFSLRLMLETMATGLACRHFDPAIEVRLRDNIDQTRRATQLLELTLLDVAFHDAIVQAARHARLHSAWANLRHQIEVWLARMHARTISPVEKTRDATVRNHQKLLDALRSGREARAVRAIRDHIEGWRRQQAAPQSETTSRKKNG